MRGAGQRSSGVHLEMKAAVNRSCASLRGPHKSNKEISNEKQLYVDHRVSALAPLSYVSPGGRHRVRVGAGRARKPHYGGALLRRLAVRSAAALRAPIGAHHHAARRALGDVRPVCPHEGEGCRPSQQARRYQRTLLFRLDAARDRRARALLRHPRGARTVEPAMAPVPVSPEFTLAFRLVGRSVWAVGLERCSRRWGSFAGCWALSCWPSLPWVARFSCIGFLAARRGRCLSSPWLLSDRPLWLPVCNSFFLKFSPRFDAIERHCWRESGGEW